MQAVNEFVAAKQNKDNSFAQHNKNNQAHEGDVQGNMKTQELKN